ncbi:hypothetical protein FSP39_009136 [Pinctada imbricata]|uniref:TIR domain-containing protein n=1 Tax=Pinctada imbricata TaxID=66713 RepID=A0AA88XZV1_PINIB|nr:hypothetical protein FSP39_009136 [Pinctada imbricata]
MDCRGRELYSVPKDLPWNTAYLLLSNNSLTKILIDSFSYLTKLTYLYLSYNNISSFAKGALAQLSELAILDITMNEFLQFQNLRNVTYGLNNTSITQLKANFLHSPKHFRSTSVIKEDLENLKNTKLDELQLDGNQIQLLQRNVLSFLPPTLRTLSVKGNDLGNIRISELRKYGIGTILSLTSLDISYQCNDYKLLKQIYVPKQNSHQPKQTKISNDNSVVCNSPDISLCTCKQLEFWTWIYSSKVVVYLSENETCKLENDSTIYMIMFRNPSVMKQYSDMCRSHAILYVSIGLVTWLLMLILVVILYAKRWELRYRWYIYRLRRKGYTPLDGSRYDYEFDAFVSYAEKDADFVKTKMITKLETEYGCHLCLHERDFRVGEKIASNIISAIHNSNKTIVVLSPEYLKSNWCKYELHMANKEEHHQDRKVVVLLVLEQVKKRDLPAEVLEHYRTNTYIELPEHEENMGTFWDALRESIS